MITNPNAIKSHKILLRLLLAQIANAIVTLTLGTIDSGNLAVVNSICLIWTLVACVGSAIWLASIDKWNAMRPITWAILTNALYFGFGPLLRTFGSELTVKRADVLFAIDQEAVFVVNLLNTLFLCCLLAGYLFTIKISPVKEALQNELVTNDRDTESRAILMAIATFFVGSFVRFFFALPHEFGNSNYVLSGTIYQLELFVPVALAPIFYLASRRGTLWKVLAVGLLLFDVSIGFLRAAKSSMVFGVVMASIGTYVSRKSRWLAASLVILGIVLFAVLNEATMNLREELFSLGSVRSSMGLNDRVELIFRMYEENRLFKPKSEGNASWARLDYTSVQAFFMNRYDNGQPGNPYRNALWAFVPRVLYPDKPITSQIGFEMGQLIMGPRSKTQVGAGFAAEAYWTGGWYCVILIGMITGFIFALVQLHLSSVPSIAIWTFFPCNILALRMALRLDGFFSIDCVGAFVIFLGIFYTAKYLERFVYGHVLTDTDEALNSHHERSASARYLS